MSDSSTPQKALEAVQGSRHAGAARVLGYAEKQAAWLKEVEQRERRAERKVTRKKRLRLAGKVTAFLVVFTLIIGVIIAAVMGIAHLSQEASKNAQVAASASASATPSATPSPTPSSTPSPTPTSASPKPSPSRSSASPTPTPSATCEIRDSSKALNSVGDDSNGVTVSGDCFNHEGHSKLRGTIFTAIILISILAMVGIIHQGVRQGSVRMIIVPVVLIVIVGLALNLALQVLL